MRRSGNCHRRDSGFALLFVFLLSAAIAIVLYKELPRVAFESRRVREEMLIERGEQYRRAIQLFNRKFKRYPPTLEALEDTNNFRFLRRRFKDPMTGKDDWRLIHGAPGGVLLDSLVTKPPGKEEQAKQSVNTYIGELPSLGSPSAQAASGAGGLPPRRASEGGAPAGEVPAGMEAAGEAPVTQMTGFPQPGAQPSSGVFGFAPIQIQPGAAPQTYGQQPGSVLPPGIYPQLMPGQPPYAPAAGQPQGPSLMPVPGLPAPYTQPLTQQPGAGQPGASPMIGGPLPFQIPTTPPGTSPVSPTAAQNPAARMIMDLLTRPNPQGLAAIRQAGTGGTVGVGIAGVASKMEAESIKVYNDRSKYQEWEFIFDPRMDRMTTPAPGTPGAPGGPALPGQPQGPSTGPQPGFPPVQPAPGLPLPRR